MPKKGLLRHFKKKSSTKDEKHSGKGDEDSVVGTKFPNEKLYWVCGGVRGGRKGKKKRDEEKRERKRGGRRG